MSILLLVSGEDEFLLEREVLVQAQTFLPEWLRRYTFPDEAPLYLQDAQTEPLDSGKRVFMVFDAKEIPDLPSCERDVLIVATEKPFRDSRAKRTVAIPKMRNTPDGRDVIAWIQKEGEKFTIDLSRVAPALFVNCGNCLRKLASEIEKISILCPPNSKVRPEDARQVMCFSAELTPRDVTESICLGQPVRALAFYDKLQEKGDETGWIIAYMQRHVLQFLRLRELEAAGKSDDETADLLGVPPFIFRSLLAPRRGLWTRASLAQSYERLCKLDIDHKLGRDSKLGLELEIIRLSREAKI